MKTKKTNQEITFDIVEDVEGDFNRGWQVDKISAIANNLEVGYLKLAYIPRERFKQGYPTIFNWMHQIRGNIILPMPSAKQPIKAWRESETRHYNTFSTEELRIFLNKVNINVSRGDISHALANLPHEELCNRVNVMENYLMTIHAYKREFKKFETYYVDKPIDDFIRVAASYQREGIAEHLYRVGVHYLDSKGLPFYLSKLRQPAAAKMADKFRESGQIRKMSNGRERFITNMVPQPY